jgi:hypothetical protein
VKNMPFGDRTGRLGRGRNCDSVAIGDRVGGFGRGRGFGCRGGFGRGFGRGMFAEGPNYAPARITKADEKEMLKTEQKAIEQDLKDIKKRLQELK